MLRWWAKLFGDRGEREAVRYVRGLGWRILARKHRNRLGEIDLIAQDGDTIVFIEVKTRRSNAAGRPEDAITPAKQKQLTGAALAFLKKHRLLERRARFDVISIVWPDMSAAPEIEHFRNAFPPVGFGQMYS